MKAKEKTLIDEDAETVSLCKKGDVDAFEELVRKYQKKMFNIAYRMVGSYEDASEVVQDAFVSAYKSIRNFREQSRFSTWLYVIVVNLSRNRLKQIATQRSHEQFSIDDPILTDEGSIQMEPASNEPSVLEKLEKRNIQNKVQKCIDSLDTEFREVLVLRDIQGFAYDEISRMLNIAEGTVKSRLFRAREAIKNCLKKVLGNL
ncbi:MAG: sigma-70 family RNA polymerase sigma factor [Nitrospirae bacterium]|nr:sigma-70 family RNA polymerase sigma factor [Nitrospirota bacterium]